MRFSTASEWITWMSSLHTSEIDLGLERIKVVADRLSIQAQCPVITVGGTNGKGSTVTGLESIYRQAGYKVGAFTSPMLFRPNEQIRIDGKEVSDEMLCVAFEQVANALETITLTQFEFFTLAALVILKQHELDAWILEVGLGGRLDAVNIIDADVAVVTTIALDHTEWLGDSREKIGYEKAGIFRKDKPAVCGDVDPPKSLIKYAGLIGARLFCQGKDFSYLESNEEGLWNFSLLTKKSQNDSICLPINNLATQNMSTVLMVIKLLQTQLPVTEETIKAGLEKVNLPGRIEIIKNDVTQIFDVSHNPASIALLEKKLTLLAIGGKKTAVFSMLGDKDITECINTIKNVIDEWYVAPLAIKRGASTEKLLDAFKQADVKAITMFADIKNAYQQAIKNAKHGDCIIVFGSFHTIEIIKNIK